MLWLWLYLAVAALIAGGSIWVTRDTLWVGGWDATAADVVATLALALGWPLFLIGGLGGFLVFVINPDILSVFRNQPGGA